MVAIRYSVAGYFVAAFGVADLLGSAAVGFVLDALIVDLVAVAAVVLGVRTAAGHPTAARVSVGVMAYYLVLAVVLAAAGSLWPDRLRIGRRSVSAEEMAWVQAACAGVVLWSAVAIALLRWALRATGSEAEPTAAPDRGETG